jgi:hypothetical protein
MGIHQQAPFIAWIIDTLETGGLTVGDGIKPTPVPEGAGYVVVYSIAGGTTTGSVNDPRSDAEPNIQVTSSSTSQEQCRWLADRVRTLLDAAVPAVLTGGRKVIWFDFPMASYSMVRDDDVAPPRWSIPDRMEMGTA